MIINFSNFFFCSLFYSKRPKDPLDRPTAQILSTGIAYFQNLCTFIKVRNLELEVT